MSTAVRPQEAPDQAGTATGTWAVVVASFCVVATFAASLTFFTGFLRIAALPGEMPPINHIPQTAATHSGKLLMATGLGLFAVAAVLGVIGLVAGIRLVRSATGFRRGVWAIALTACTPVLAIMLLSGMGAS